MGPREGVHGWGMGGWVQGRGIPGTHPAARGEVPEPAERARKALQGPGVVGSGSSDVPATGTGFWDHPLRCAPGPAPLSQNPSECRLLANSGGIDLILL